MTTSARSATIARPTTRPTPATDAAALGQLIALGFSDEVRPVPRRLIISSEGLEKSGKSHFALTGPDPIVYIDVDLGTEGVVEKFQAAGKKVLKYEVRIPKGESQEVYSTLWANVQQRLRKAYSLSQGTVVWDTCSELFELCRLARFGRLTQVQPHNYMQVNSEWRDFLRVAFDSPMNTDFIHKQKAVWLNTTGADGKLKSIKTREVELAGFAEMPYLAQVNLVHYRKQGENGVEFSVLIKDCRQNKDVIGEMLTGPMCDFGVLLGLVHGPETA